MREDDTSTDVASSELKRALALDVGDRRIGLALSDPLGYTAQPLFTLHRTSLRADLKAIARVIRKYVVSEIVVGLPLHASGALSQQALKTRAFIDKLLEQHPGIHLYFLDERFTTAEAHNLLDDLHRPSQSKTSRQQRTAVVDQVAAVLLLEAYLSVSSPRLLPPPSEL